MTLILGIETTCDETAVALVDDGRNVRCNLIASQIDIHQRYGGVVPEIAARAHLTQLDLLVKQALDECQVTPDQIDAVAVSNRPGLIGCLLIGVTAAKTLAWAWDKPLVDVNHIHAHATSAGIDPTPAFAPRNWDAAQSPWPGISLVVSGGHTSLFEVRDPLSIRELGRTIDDAAGEAFDKVAAILNIGFPGGPLVDRLARHGNDAAISFPRSMLGADSLDFSFSGLKTAVLYGVHGAGKTSGGLERLTDANIADICASFSRAVVDVIVHKTLAAAKRTRSRSIMVGGGVAANSMLRAALTDACRDRGLALFLTPMKYCTDNGAMIAAHGYHLFAAGHSAELDLAASASARDPS